MSLRRWLCVLALAATLGACGDDSPSDADGGGDGDGDGDQTPGPIEVMVEAAEGGEIETEGAGIVIPGGALSEDTEITVSVVIPNGLPDEDSLASLVYDFGPDGTQFEQPVELTIELNAAVPSGMEAKLAWLDEDEGAWMPLADSQLSDDEVTATTDHFTMFAVVIVAGQGQTEGSCEDFADFEACGGELAGTWELMLACADVATDELLAELMCDGATVEINADISGMITFDAEGGYESEITRELAFALSLPTSCLMDATCEQFAQGGEFEESGDVCTLQMGEDPVTEMETGSYELDGNTVILMDATATEADPPAEYCVEGDTLTVRITEVDEETMEETVTFMQATRP